MFPEIDKSKLAGSEWNAKSARLRSNGRRRKWKKDRTTSSNNDDDKVNPGSETATNATANGSEEYGPFRILQFMQLVLGKSFRTGFLVYVRTTRTSHGKKKKK